MTVYADLVAFFNFGVDLLLLLGTNRLSGHPPGMLRCAAASALGGVYAGACLFPGFSFLSNGFWRLVCLGCMAAVAFGFHRSALRRSLLFLLLSMALGGGAYMLGIGGFWGIVASAGGLCLLCVLGFRERVGSVSFVPVELSYGDAKVRITALRDTGNTLSDPVTGQSVLVVGAQVAGKLTGLSVQQLCDPVGSMGALPGLRLIPYRGVGQSAGMLLGLRLPDVKIGTSRGSRLVAFAPADLSSDGEYQALAGGVI